MQFVCMNTKKDQRYRWQRFWPITWLILIIFVQLLVISVTLVTEFWSMIVNIKYAFFFIGFIAALFYIVTWISTCSTVFCWQPSIGCATHALIEHILSIIASAVWLFYDIRFLANPLTCLWPNGWCNEELLELNVFSIKLGTGAEISSWKLIMIKIQIACAAIMIANSIVFIAIYISTSIRIRKKDKVADPHTTIELGRMPSPPAPSWPTPPRPLPESSEF